MINIFFSVNASDKIMNINDIKYQFRICMGKIYSMCVYACVCEGGAGGGGVRVRVRVCVCGGRGGGGGEVR